MDFKSLQKEELESQLANERKIFKKLQKAGKTVDMTRGRPCKEQLDISVPMLSMIAESDFQTALGDCRNYGVPDGLKEARALMADIFDVKPEETKVADSSSLSIMYDVMQFAKQFGILESTPWNKLPKVKFICPAPGYDRHFSICEALGIEMVTIPMTEEGPDMDMVESLIKDDESIKGIWCVPKFGNPSGVTYSDAVVERLANLEPAAEDFRIFYDNAYYIHSLYDTDVQLKNIFDIMRKNGKLNMIYMFGSTSKVTFASAGISAIMTSEENLKDLNKHFFYKTIGPNKVVQLAHVLFMKNKENAREIMKKHAEVIRPKFEAVDKKLSEAFEDDKWVNWNKPLGGYFISLNVKSCAKRIVELANEAGVKFTAAGATFPYKMDDFNQNIRIAPTVPSLGEMDFAMDVLISAIKIARMEKVLEKCFA